MNLSKGELSNIDGCLLLMTATASSSTVRLLKSQFPEIKSWHDVITPPLRHNVTMVVPPPKIVSSRLDVSLAPFISDMNSGRTYLIIVRGMY